MGLAGGGAQGETSRALAGNYADVRGVVFECGGIADELVLQRSVGVEDGGEPVAEGFAGQRGEVRPDGVADALELMAGTAGRLKHRCTALGVGLQLGKVGVTRDDLGAVGIGAAKELAGACGESGLFVSGQPLLMRGADLAGGQGVLFQRIEQRGGGSVVAE